MMLFVGWADDEFSRTGHRNLPELRKGASDPSFVVHGDEVERLGMKGGDWARITTSTGSIVSRVYARSGMPKGLTRVPHVWWKPESLGGLDKVSGIRDFSDDVITADDDPELIDIERGVLNLKGMRCALTKSTVEEVAKLEAQYGPTENMSRGPEGKMLHPKSDPKDFMHDELAGDGVEFEAIALSICGRTSKL